MLVRLASSDFWHHTGNRIAFANQKRRCTAAHLEFVAVWQPIRLAIGLHPVAFICISTAVRLQLVRFFACFCMAVLRLPLLLLLPSGPVFYVVKVLRYARLTGKGKADFLAASALRHAYRLSAQCMRPTATATQLSSVTFAKKSMCTCTHSHAQQAHMQRCIRNQEIPMRRHFISINYRASIFLFQPQFAVKRQFPLRKKKT